MSNTDSNGLKKHPKDENALGNESANESAAPVANGNEEVSENTEDGTRAAKKKGIYTSKKGAIERLVKLTLQWQN